MTTRGEIPLAGAEQLSLLTGLDSLGLELDCAGQLFGALWKICSGNATESEGELLELAVGYEESFAQVKDEDEVSGNKKSRRQLKLPQLAQRFLLLEPEEPNSKVKVSHRIRQLDTRRSLAKVGKTFECNCPKSSIDQQRSLYCGSYLASSSSSTFLLRHDKQETDIEPQTKAEANERKVNLAPNGLTEKPTSRLTQFVLPESELQLAQFWSAQRTTNQSPSFSRNSVAKRLAAARAKRKLNASSQMEKVDSRSINITGADFMSPIALYKLEQLLRESNTQLAEILLEESRNSLSFLAQVCGRNSNSGDFVAAGSSEDGSFQPATSCDQLRPAPMIRAPVAEARVKSFMLTLQSGNKPQGDDEEEGEGGNGSRRQRMISARDRRLTWSLGSSNSIRRDSGLHSTSSEDTFPSHSDFEQHPASGADDTDHNNNSPADRDSYSTFQRLVGFRSERRIQLLVARSIDLFAELIDSCPLLKAPISGNEKIQGSKLMFTSQELKLFACIECQKLRSALRFRWLSLCLELVFARDPQLDDSARAHDVTNWATTTTKQQTSVRLNGRRRELPSIWPEDLETEPEVSGRFLDRVARLMGQLLRSHFLVPAIDKWCLLFELHQRLVFADSTPKAGPSELLAGGVSLDLSPKLRVQVELLEEGDTKKRLASSRPEAEVRETLGFAVDELAAICSRLPRIETQLESLESEDVHLVALQAGDSLIEDTKRRLNSVIDGCCFASRGDGQSLVQKECDLEIVFANERNQLPLASGSSWLNVHYLIMVELVNKLRCGQDPFKISLDQQTEVESRFQGNEKETTRIELPPDDRLRKLHFCRREIELLNEMELRLTTNSNSQLCRYQDHGFVQLDCGPLRDSLLKCVEKERRLLIRLLLDEQLRLMDQLRLQFEEIEFGLDLELAIEDHLAERRQLKRQNLQQVLLLTSADGGDDDFTLDLTSSQADEFQRHQSARGEKKIAAAGSKDSWSNWSDQDEDDELFVEAITHGGGSGQLHNADTKLTTDESAAGELAGSGMDEQWANRQLVAPYVECRLLVERYEFAGRLLNHDIRLLTADLEIFFEGLVFISEFVASEQLEPHHSELIGDLVARSREFRPQLKAALSRLHSARFKLRQLIGLRSRVISSLVLEFGQLMSELCRRKLATEAAAAVGGDRAPEEEASGELQPEETSGQQGRGGRKTSGGSSSRPIVQLDAIQETAEWSQQLNWRLLYLWRQNRLLGKEDSCLASCSLDSSNPFDLDSSEKDASRDEIIGQEVTQLRGLYLERWRRLAAALATYWRLAEQLETQQVKWLNSDTKRIDFNLIESSFNEFRHQLTQLKRQVLASNLTDINGEDYEILGANLRELERRAHRFKVNRLPLFKFLTNKHLTPDHWAQVTEMLASGRSADSSLSTQGLNFGLSMAPQSCTTLAQFLELGAELFINELTEISRCATIEQELTDFLLVEAGAQQRVSSQKGAQLRALALEGQWFAGWSDEQLAMAASRFIQLKITELNPDEGDNQLNELECRQLAARLVSSHQLVRRFLQLSYSLDLAARSGGSNQLPSGRLRLTLRSCNQLSSSQLVSPSMFVAFLRLFTDKWLAARGQLAQSIGRRKLELERVESHLSEIRDLSVRVDTLRDRDLRLATEATESALVEMERETLRLELEREVLATREALALERQREAHAKRDDCVTQIGERAVPAIRAAAKALDCLDGRSLRALRNYKPQPPACLRLVLEAVCLLRSCCLLESAGTGSRPMEPERRFDSLSGRIQEDYWPPTSRVLNGTHSSRLLLELRRLDKRRVPAEVMRLIRRRYLSHPQFNVGQIKRVSPECGLLAKWLLAVDVFDRVLMVVRPNYAAYLAAEQQLAALLAEVDERRRETERIGQQLKRTEEMAESKMRLKMSLADSLDQCCGQLKLVEVSRGELKLKRREIRKQLAKFRRRQLELANECLLEAARAVYLEPMGSEQRWPMTRLLSAHLLSSGGPTDSRRQRK